jgi:hypothetical protein
MARPPQFAAPEEPWDDAKAVRAAEDRAVVLAWLCMYYRDDGAMFSAQISRRRQRITLGGTDYWLVRVPKRS